MPQGRSPASTEATTMFVAVSDDRHLAPPVLSVQIIPSGRPCAHGRHAFAQVNSVKSRQSPDSISVRWATLFFVHVRARAVGKRDGPRSRADVDRLDYLSRRSSATNLPPRPPTLTHTASTGSTSQPHLVADLKLRIGDCAGVADLTDPHPLLRLHALTAGLSP